MIETKKRPACGRTERRPADTGRDVDKTIIAWCVRRVKQFAAMVGCLFGAFGVLMFLGALIEGTMSRSAALALMLTAGFVCVMMYRCADEEGEGHE